MHIVDFLMVAYLLGAFFLTLVCAEGIFYALYTKSGRFRKKIDGFLDKLPEFED